MKRRGTVDGKGPHHVRGAGSKRGSEAGVVELLSASYALDLDEESHMRALHEAWTQTSLGSPASVAFAWHADGAGGSVVEHVRASLPGMTEIFAQVLAASSRHYVLSLLRSRPLFGLLSDHYSRTRAQATAARTGFPDFVGLNCPTGTGFVLCVGTPLPPNTPRPAASEQLSALADHLAAAWRLRKRLASPDAFADNAEVVCRPDGRVVHAAGPGRRVDVRDRLRATVLARERTLRGRSATLWPALLDGRYTIVDRVEGPSARYVIAYRNAPTAASLSRLTPEERVVVEGTAAGTAGKVLAIELGRSQAWVSRVLQRALRRLGIAGAIELTLLAGSGEVIGLDDEVLGQGILAAFAIRGATADALLQLTPSERAVTADILRGLGNREIAARRNRSERTIANQVASVLDRLGAPSRRALAAMLRDPGARARTKK